jgi:hypothetical protein
MSSFYKCDGCGKETPAAFYKDAKDYGKPSSWFQRGDEDGIQDACSRECVDKISKNTGKTGVVLPF